MLTNMQYEILLEQFDGKHYSKNFPGEEQEKVYEAAISEAKSIVKSVGLCESAQLTSEQELSEMVERIQSKLVNHDTEQYVHVFEEGIRDTVSVIESFYRIWRKRI